MYSACLQTHVSILDASVSFVVSRVLAEGVVSNEATPHQLLSVVFICFVICLGTRTPAACLYVGVLPSRSKLPEV